MPTNPGRLARCQHPSRPQCAGLGCQTLRQNCVHTVGFPIHGPAGPPPRAHVHLVNGHWRGGLWGGSRAGLSAPGPRGRRCQAAVLSRGRRGRFCGRCGRRPQALQICTRPHAGAGHKYFPHATLWAHGLGLPVVEVAHQPYVLGLRRPHGESGAARALHDGGVCPQLLAGAQVFALGQQPHVGVAQPDHGVVGCGWVVGHEQEPGHSCTYRVPGRYRWLHANDCGISATPRVCAPSQGR